MTQTDDRTDSILGKFVMRELAPPPEESHGIGTRLRGQLNRLVFKELCQTSLVCPLTTLWL